MLIRNREFMKKKTHKKQGKLRVRVKTKYQFSMRHHLVHVKSSNYSLSVYIRVELELIAKYPK